MINPKHFKYVAGGIVGLILMVIVVETVIIGTPSKKDQVPQDVKKNIRPETVLFSVEYKARLQEQGIWHVKHSGKTSNYIEIKQNKRILPGSVVAVTACYNDYLVEEQINNELINLDLKSSLNSELIDRKSLLEKKYDLQEKKAGCEIRNDTGTIVDFIPRPSTGEITEGDIVGFFVDRANFKQEFRIDGISSNPIDALALVIGAGLVISAEEAISDGKIWEVSEDNGVLTAIVQPDETFRKEKIYLDKETVVKISRPIELTKEEFERAQKTTSAELIVLRRN